METHLIHLVIWGNMVSEKFIESKLVKAVKERGGLAIKLASPGFDGLPDRLVILAKAKIGFVEVKALGKKPTKLQRVRLRQLKELGFLTYVLDDVKNIGGIIDEICGS